MNNHIYFNMYQYYSVDDGCFLYLVIFISMIKYLKW